MLRRHGYAACGLVALLGLAGCTGGSDDPPATSSTSSATTTGSTSSGPTTTTSSPTTPTVDIPAAARAHTEAGAEAFVKYYVEQSNVASMKADTTILPPLSDAGCESCQQLQGQVEELKAKGHHYRSAPITVSKVTAVNGGQNGQQFVRLQMTQNLADVVDAAGKTVSTDPRAELARTTSLIWVGERWLVFGIAQ